jgi:hypothetical protein
VVWSLDKSFIDRNGLACARETLAYAWVLSLFSRIFNVGEVYQNDWGCRPNWDPLAVCGLTSVTSQLAGERALTPLGGLEKSLFVA